ncbi:hypothetical protein C9J48_18495 [Photobacterium profundum]|nr:hypothetical protein C9J48_18495 [Photobacterium profundum]
MLHIYFTRNYLISVHSFHSIGLTAFPQAMPDIYKVNDEPIFAYRRFYLGDIAKFAKWTKRNPPECFSR